MQEIINYLKEHPRTSTNTLRLRFGISKGRAFAIRKELGLVTDHIGGELKQKVQTFLAENPSIPPAEVQRKFGLTAMVVRRIRRDLNLLGSSVAVRVERDERIKQYLMDNPSERTLVVANFFDVSCDVIERLKREVGIPRQTCANESYSRRVERAEVGLTRREDRPAESGVISPVPVSANQEQWKKLDAPLSKYSVSSMGRVRNEATGKLLRHRQNIRGYWVISLSTDEGKMTVKRTHRLVAEAFLPNPEGRPEVNHKDGDTSNPRKSNLEWATKAENMEHASREGLFTVAKISPGTARAICESLSRRKAEGRSLRQVAEAHEVPVTLVEKISARKTWNSISCEYEW